MVHLKWIILNIIKWEKMWKYSVKRLNYKRALGKIYKNTKKTKEEYKQEKLKINKKKKYKAN